MEEEGSSWLRRAKFSNTVYQRLNSTRETRVLSSAQAKRDLKLKMTSLSIESKALSYSLDVPSVLLLKQSVRDSQSLEVDASSLELKLKSLSSELKQKGSRLNSTLMPNSRPSHIDWNLVSKAKELNVDSLSSPNTEPKPKPSILDTTNICFYPNEDTQLSSKWSDSAPTPSLSCKLDHDSRKSGNFSFHCDGGSKWSDSNMVHTPSLSVKWDQNSRSCSMPSDRKEPNSKPKKRSISPLPSTIISDIFKEAKSVGKRFSTPHPSRKVSLPRAETSPMKHLSSLKAVEKSKKKGLNVDSLSSPNSELKSKPKPKPSTLDTTSFCFYPNEDTQLSSKWSDSAPTPSLSGKLDHDSRKSGNFSFHCDGGSKWSDSNMVHTPSLRVKLDQNSRSCSMPSDRKERNSKLKRRSISPLPTTIISDIFKEAKSVGKRFSTPHPSRKVSLPRAETSPMKHLSSLKAAEKSKKKDSSWAKYHGGGRVTAVEATDEWMVDLSKLYIGLRFASGAHSRLYHGIYKDQPIAVKIIRQPDDDENGVMAARLENEFVREVTFLSHLSHCNVIKLSGACKNPPVFCIITEYLSGGSLRAFLNKLDHKPLPLKKLISISLEIARGMEYIHLQGIVHRDLKPGNILFDQDFCVKIADFGIACEEAYCDALAEDLGTYRWMAPEMIKHKPYGRKVDVYSFGLVLWEMVSGTIPYEGMTPIQAAFAVANKKTRPVIPLDCPAALRALIEQCWASHQEKRPEFWQIVKVLEQFESALARDGTLDQLPNLTCQDHKNRLIHWIQKLKPSLADGIGPPNPKLL